MGHALVVAVPLRAGVRTVGFMGLAFADPDPVSPERIELAQALANQAVLALELMRLADAARGAAVTEERNRLARDIHDILAQDFVAIMAHLRSMCRPLAGTGTLNAADTASLDAALATARHSLVRARRSVRALIPQTGDQYLVLADALRAFVLGLPKDDAARVEVRERGAKHSLSQDTSEELLAIAREAITNALRHGGREAYVLVEVATGDDGTVELWVEDDGAGFDPLAAPGLEAGHYGMWTMRERALRLGGTFLCDASPSEGTRVQVRVPRLHGSDAST